MLLPFYREQPSLVNVPGSDLYYIPIFGTEEELRASLTVGEVQFDKIKQIEPNVPEFLQSLAEATIPLRLMVNPHFVNGKLRWSELNPAQVLMEWENNL